MNFEKNTRLRLLNNMILGYSSVGKWRAKCVKKKKNFMFKPKKLTNCQTCSEVPEFDKSIQSTQYFDKNMPVWEFFCGNDSQKLHFLDSKIENGDKRRVKCRCKRNKNGKVKEKACKWEHRKGKTFTNSDFSQIKCK